METSGEGAFTNLLVGGAYMPPDMGVAHGAECSIDAPQFMQKAERGGLDPPHEPHTPATLVLMWL